MTATVGRLVTAGNDAMRATPRRCAARRPRRACAAGCARRGPTSPPPPPLARRDGARASARGRSARALPPPAEQDEPAPGDLDVAQARLGQPTRDGLVVRRRARDAAGPLAGLQERALASGARLDE